MVQNVGMGSISEEKQKVPITMDPEINLLRDNVIFLLVVAVCPLHTSILTSPILLYHCLSLSKQKSISVC